MRPLLPNSVNKMYLVCHDIATIEDPIYLFRFVNAQTQEQYLIELDNLAIGNSRFDLFELALPDDLDLPAGMYHYHVYQSEEENDENFEGMPELASGRVDVATEFIENETYEPTDGPDEVYQPEPEA